MPSDTVQYYALYLHRCDPLSAHFTYGSDTVITHNLSISASELNINMFIFICFYHPDAVLLLLTYEKITHASLLVSTGG